MKVLLVSTSDIEGGAARAAYRLHQGLRGAGAASYMLVQDKAGSDQDVLGPSRKIDKGLYSLRPTLDLLPLYLTGKSGKPISTAWLPDRLKRRLCALGADVINLHWINKGFVQIGTIANLPAPVVWTLHDMWPFTGGCHYDLGCERYTERCGACPQLGSHKELDLTRWIWRRKARAWRSIDLTLVCPSRWLAECAARSSLFAGRRIEVIANGLDVQRFRPADRSAARQWLGLPLDKKLILFSAVGAIDNYFKGFPSFQQAMQILAEMETGEEIEIVILGMSPPGHPPALPFRAHYLGYLRDELSLALVYSAVDAFVATPLQDNLPNTVVESLACGVPCAGFRVGGIPDIVEHQVTGYLVDAGDVQALASGIHWILEDKERWSRLSHAARARAVRDFDQQRQARRYLELYEALIEKQQRRQKSVKDEFMV